MTEDRQIDQLKIDADFLLSSIGTISPQEVKEVVHRLRQFHAFVLDRDAGPNRDAKAEILRLQTKLDEAEAIAVKLAGEYAAYREKTKPLVAECHALRNEIQWLKSKFSNG